MRGAAALAVAGCLNSEGSSESSKDLKVSPVELFRPIPSTGELLPAVGLGTYQTFSQLGDAGQQARLQEVLSLFARSGGTVLDSSPMYSQAEAVLGALLPKVKPPKKGWFTATKVWTDGAEAGKDQIEESFQAMGVEKIDLLQVHNLRDWRTHFPHLKELQQEKRIRYTGLTTWGGHSHGELEDAMTEVDVDFIQVTYNILNREVEERILPLAEEAGIAVVVNRPFGQGQLFKRVAGKTLPQWAVREIECETWAQFFLKYILADTRVTVAIPATSKPHHLVENMGAGRGPLPDPTLRERMRAVL